MPNPKLTSMRLRRTSDGMAEVSRQLGSANIVLWVDTVKGCAAYIWRHRRVKK